MAALRSRVALGCAAAAAAVLVACGPARDRSASPGDSVLTAQRPLPAAAPNAAPTPAPSPDTLLASRDSTRISPGIFMPDGDLAPVDSLWQVGHSLEFVWLYTMDIAFPKPRLRDHPSARLVIEPIGGELGTDTTTECRPPLVTRDTVALDCPGGPMGDFTINGHWVPIPDTTTNEANRPVYEQLALVARVVIKRGGAVVFDHVERFEYMEEGD